MNNKAWRVSDLEAKQARLAFGCHSMIVVVLDIKPEGGLFRVIKTLLGDTARYYTPGEIVFLSAGQGYVLTMAE